MQLNGVSLAKSTNPPKDVASWLQPNSLFRIGYEPSGLCDEVCEIPQGPYCTVDGSRNGNQVTIKVKYVGGKLANSTDTFTVGLNENNEITSLTQILPDGKKANLNPNRIDNKVIDYLNVMSKANIKPRKAAA